MTDSRVEEVLEEYLKMPKELRKQVSKVSKVLLSNRVFKEKLSKFIRKELNAEERDLERGTRRILAEFYTLRRVNPMQVFSNEVLFRITYCYDEKGNTINLKTLLKVGKHACVSLGLLKKREEDYKRVIEESIGFQDSDEKQVVVKWYRSEKNDIDFESSIYKRLYQLGCPLPFFSTKFKFWNEPVLVIEKLMPLDAGDDPYEVGVHIIYQLFFLHKIGVHCDIKPQNIMKKYKGGKPQYFLIDFGGVATEHLGSGFRRWLWSPKWTCQRPHQKNQVVYPIHDLVELGFTMNFLRTKGSENFKRNFKGLLLSYMKCIRNMKEIPETEDYIKLIDILREKA